VKEVIARVEVVLVLGVEARRLGEAVVEEAEAAAGDVGHQAIKDPAARFIGVEAEIEEVPQEAAALRDAEAVHAVDRGLAVGAAQRVCRAFVVP
jgi:hypothetical protein